MSSQEILSWLPCMLGLSTLLLGINWLLIRWLLGGTIRAQKNQAVTSKEVRDLYAQVTVSGLPWNEVAIRIMALDFNYFNQIAVEATANYIKDVISNKEQFLQKIEDIYALRGTGFTAKEIGRVIDSMFIPEEQRPAIMVAALCTKEQFQQIKARVLQGV